MTVLVFLEHENNVLRHNSLAALTAAAIIDTDIHVLLAGENNLTSLAQQAATYKNVSKVWVYEHSVFAHLLPESLAICFKEIAENYSHILSAATSTSRSFLPRLAALLDVQPISDVVKIVDASTFVRPMYAGSVMATVKSSDAIKILTIRASSFATPEANAQAAASVEAQAVDENLPQLTTFVSHSHVQSERPELENAKIIISGGRGMKNEENFRLLYPLADKLDAAIGASRAAVDSGFASNEFQVGQTGKIVAPELYIAVGISGAIQHVAGMKDSRIIVAINNDPNAPIFQIADYGLVADFFDILPELREKLPAL